ncbi:P2Y purinoceptor 8-like [Pantherophis guttatus]|uniref:P2Y purinoceptor 8-like n=1 Tax=Pantherophis guttatus TaxID=94885 RepID=A0A6P9D6Z2_PANGU|nr:P2Y purinoceptor 8-like [Pantherophis guttatus]XP_034287315.1 P2Y purinoceptor 8-like [Pantherophis guttatus]XP_060542643.1 P2Y purinoceptor 8-like [Pantherophis guttatus]
MMKNTSLDNATINMLKNPDIVVILPIVYSLVVIISIPGNIFSLWILFFHIKPKTTSILLMINLSLTDLALASCLPLQIIYHLKKNHWSYSKQLCSYVTIMFYANMYSSILTMTFISFERYLGVVYPLTSQKWRKKRYAIATCIVMWFIVLLSLWPLASTDLTFKVNQLNITTCFDVLYWNMLPGVLAWGAFLLLPFFFFFLLPFTITVACYTAIIWKLIQASHKYGNGQKTRSVYLAIIVLLVFIICFAPNNFILLVHIVSRLTEKEGYYHIYKLTLCLSCLNNCIDPFIYYFASKEFYQKSMQVVGRKVLLSDSSETRRESVLSTRTSGRSLSSGHKDGFDVLRTCLQRHESVF